MTTKTQDTIVRTMTIDEIFSSFPQKAQRLAQVMMQRGLQCVGCQAATWETIEVGMMGHGFEDEEVDELVAELNEVLQEPQPDPNSITLSSRAAEKYRAILADEGKQGWGLRFEERAAGCSGFEYVLDYSEIPSEEDAVFESQGIEIHIPKHMIGRLIGSEIDYTDGLHGAGFKISNPNVRSSCGCGSSHGY